jgi:hypothetical protein
VTGEEPARPGTRRGCANRPSRPTDPAYLSRTEAARYIGMSVSSLAHWSMEGIGPELSLIGRNSFYHRRDLDVWLAERAGSRRVARPFRAKPKQAATLYDDHNWPEFWDIRTKFSSQSQAAVYLRICLKRRKKMLITITRQISTQNLAAAIDLSNRYLNSQAAHVASLGRAHKKARGRLSKGGSIDAMELVNSANSLSAAPSRLQYDHGFTLRGIDGQSQTVTCVGLMLFAASLLVQDVAKAIGFEIADAVGE